MLWLAIKLKLMIKINLVKNKFKLKKRSCYKWNLKTTTKTILSRKKERKSTNMRIAKIDWIEYLNYVGYVSKAYLKF